MVHSLAVRVFVLGLAALLGCTPIMPFRPDASTPTDVDAGVTDAGASPRPIAWSVITLPDAGPVQAVAGNGRETFALVNNRLSRLVGTELVPLSSPTVSIGRALFVTPFGAVHAIGTTQSTFCAARCEEGTNHRLLPDRPGDLSLRICGLGETVFAVADRGGTSTVLLDFVASRGWGDLQASPALAIGEFVDCLVLPSTEVLVAGTRGVTRLTRAGAVVATEPFDLQGQTRISWNDMDLTVTTSGELRSIVIVGGDGAYRSAQRTGEAWRALPAIEPGVYFERVTGWSETDEFFAWGSRQVGGTVTFRFSNGRWSPLVVPVDQPQLFGTSGPVLFVGGSSGGRPGLFRGTLQ